MALAWINRVHTVNLAEGALEACCYGPPPAAAPTIVLLHEGLGCLARWRDSPARLSTMTGCGVLAYSRYGYGQSAPVALPRPLDYLMIEAVQVLPALLDAYAIDRPLPVGHSDGGSIATIYAARVRQPGALVMLAPHFFVEDCSVAAIAAARREFLEGDLAERMARYHDDVEGAFHGWCDAWLDPDFVNGWNIEDDIRAIDCPTLAIQGKQDPYGTTEQYRCWRSKTNFDLALLSDCGHNPIADQTERSLGLIADFLRRRI